MLLIGFSSLSKTNKLKHKGTNRVLFSQMWAYLMKNLNAAAFSHITEPNHNLEATGLNFLTAKNTRSILKSWLSFYTRNNDPNTTTYPNFERKLKLFKMRPVGSSLSHTQRWLHACFSSFQNLMHQSSEFLDKQKRSTSLWSAVSKQL